MGWKQRQADEAKRKGQEGREGRGREVTWGTG